MKAKPARPGSVERAASLQRTRQIISAGRRSADAAPASNCFNTLSNGVQVGQMLIISNASSASFGVTNGAFNIGDTGNVNLAANPRTFGLRDNLTLLWDGEQWIEISFTNN
jgi:hypothetical protein